MKIVKEFILRNIADEAILIPTGATSQEFNGLITLSATAEFIWQKIEHAASFKELVSMILDEFEADEETVINDTGKFLVGLLNKGIIEFSNPSLRW